MIAKIECFILDGLKRQLMAPDLVKEFMSEFHKAVIEKGDASFDGMPHLHAIAEHGQDVVRQHGLRPEIERYIDRIAIFELLANVELAEQSMITFAVAKLSDKLRRLSGSVRGASVQCARGATYEY